jgi:hypothetical protein
LVGAYEESADMIANHGFEESYWLDIREELRREDTEIFAELDSAIPDELTHYTSFDGLRGIITRQQIWCTDIRQVNDPR